MVWRDPDQHPVLLFTQTAVYQGLDYSTALPVPAKLGLFYTRQNNEIFKKVFNERMRYYLAEFSICIQYRKHNFRPSLNEQPNHT